MARVHKLRAALNPFNPGSGLRPPALVGREAELEALSVAVERVANGLSARGLVLSGLRGVGKTVLLNEMRNLAEDAGWLCVTLEARPDEAGVLGAGRALAREIAARARVLSRREAASQRVRSALQSVSAFNAKIGASGIDLGVELRSGRADSGDIEVDLPELVQDVCEALQDDQSAFAVFIDEMQDLDAELLRALFVTQHVAGQRGWPFFLFGAGLPLLPGVLADVRSDAERLFDYRTIGRLEDDAASAALVDPVTSQGASFTTGALERPLEAAGGYPYFLQEYGRAAWEASPGPEIRDSDASLARVLGLERLDAGFFSSRWNRATRSERRMLVAMAEEGEGPSSSSDVARRMGLRPTSLGPYRAQLIQKGLVYAPEHGLVAYTVPGMADYVGRHSEDAG